MVKEDRTKKVLEFAKSYIYPAVAIVIGMAIAWSTLSNTVYANRDHIDELQLQCDTNESVINLILQRLSSIDTKLDFIIEDIGEIK